MLNVFSIDNKGSSIRSDYVTHISYADENMSTFYLGVSALPFYYISLFWQSLYFEVIFNQQLFPDLSWERIKL